MRDSAMRASYQEYEARLQLKVRRPLSEWVQALETVRVSVGWASLLGCRSAHIPSHRPAAVRVCEQLAAQDRLPEMERLRRQLETRVTKLKRQESKAERETRRRLGACAPPAMHKATAAEPLQRVC